MSTFSIARSTHIDAPPATVHALVNDFRRWTGWSPWEGLDPDLQRSYSGADAGVGARYAWSGNNKAGQGEMAITASTPEAIGIDLSFEKPFKARNHVVVGFVPAGAGTQAVWTMSGEQGLFGRLFYKIFKMDAALGRDFERGLAQLKALAER